LNGEKYNVSKTVFVLVLKALIYNGNNIKVQATTSESCTAAADGAESFCDANVSPYTGLTGKCSPS
jgi:hypothetical protein